MTPVCSNTIVYRWSADMHRWFIEVTGELGRIEVHAWDSITPKVSRESLGILGSWRVPVGRRRALAGLPEVFPIHPRTLPSLGKRSSPDVDSRYRCRKTSSSCNRSARSASPGRSERSPHDRGGAGPHLSARVGHPPYFHDGITAPPQPVFAALVAHDCAPAGVQCAAVRRRR